MKVLLRSDVDGVGRKGDIVDVSGGYARNYLLPGGMCMVATKGMEAQAASMRRSRDLKDAREKTSAEAVAQAISGMVLRIEARAGSAGKLFGSVGQAEIAEAIAAQKSIEIDRHAVDLHDPIKTVGTTELAINLAGGVTAAISVEVVAAES